MAGTNARAQAFHGCGHVRRFAWLENATLDRFLEAMAEYVNDAKLPDPPTWATFAEILVGATIYE